MKNKNEVLISIKNLKKKYGKNEILKDVTFDISNNDRLAIVGVNGGGKTTLMEIIAGLISKTSGEIIYNFKRSTSISEAIGMQFQDAEAPSRITINDLLTFLMKSYVHPITQVKLDNLINSFGLRELLNRKINKLSGGQKQRLNLLICLLHEPELLIFDEVSTGLDIKGRMDVIKEIIKIQKKLKSAIIIVSHNPEEIELLADKILLLKNGKIDKISTISEIVKKYKKVSTFLLKHVN